MGMERDIGLRDVAVLGWIVGGGSLAFIGMGTLIATVTPDNWVFGIVVAVLGSLGAALGARSIWKDMDYFEDMQNQYRGRTSAGTTPTAGSVTFTAEDFEDFEAVFSAVKGHPKWERKHTTGMSIGGEDV